ncbi:long-chain acyl-CoA synthetase [Nocardioides luteus]|uniref:Fatty-acid--CoA ligase n=1 Tax=Nocardioides luteus TaxID=1844 RepID=A0ABQ5SR94_9ACTN|nr:AMP-binding protein [Nocardioides luteus]MDR7311127.1 long-chain acyl-CoA synthetase [Nocardioides luteus]GGR62464.1 fatty-acid--CoA ligase [Nocardioides luteus]GLJ66673.1 fatty-acid--CoA ligase [Nocardioides luteus]
MSAAEPLEGAAPGEHNLAVLAEASYAKHGDYPMIFFEGEWHTSTSIAERSARVAGGLRGLGIEPGDRVVVLTMNTPEVFVSYRALWRLGAVVTPVIFLQTPPELRHILEDSGAAAAIVTPELLPLVQAASEGLGLTVIVAGDTPEGEGLVAYESLESADPIEIAPRGDDDLAALLYTGGTTGRAKGVMLSHRGLWESGHALHRVGESQGTTRWLLPLPLSHAYGLIVVISGMHASRPQSSVLQRWFDAKGWLELAQEHRIEASTVVPSMLQMLLDQPYQDYDLGSLRSFGSGGAPLLPALREKVEEAFGVTILEGYGCTESSAVIAASSIEESRPGSVGKPLSHAEVIIAGPSGEPLPAGEEGEIWVRGPGVMQGYWNDPEQTAATLVDGWLHTGDIGHFDDDGYLYVDDRIKDLIIRGGFNVFPRDVEDALLAHEAVTAAAVVGRPDTKSGEEVVAVVALHPGAQATPEELIAFAKTRLAPHKYPREVLILDAVPVTSVGKTDRKAVRSMVRTNQGES